MNKFKLIIRRNDTKILRNFRLYDTDQSHNPPIKDVYAWEVYYIGTKLLHQVSYILGKYMEEIPFKRKNKI